jgi:quaternary ammonium compound-resistance protein SugE
MTSRAFSVIGGEKDGVDSIAGLLEVVWATSLKYNEGFTKLLPSIITITGNGY